MKKSPATKRNGFYVTEEDRTVIKKLDILINAVDKVYPHMGNLMWRSFVQGLFVALGGTVGLSIAIALLSFLLVQSKYIPVLNQLVPQKQIEKLLPDQK